MPTISFQGLCFFQRGEQDVSVYLPRADVDGSHIDRTPARAHHAALFVRDREVVDNSINGFQEASYRGVHPDGTEETVKGHVFRFSRCSPHTHFTVAVSDQGTGALNVSDLGDRIPSFGAFAPGVPKPVPINTQAVATIDLFAGHFGFRRPSTGWLKAEIAGLANSKGQVHSLQDLTWGVDWSFEPEDQDVVIKILDENGNLEGSVAVRSDTRPSGIMMCNLDDFNPAAWVFRRNMTLAECEDIAGKRTGRKPCYDNDFKWFYTLFPGWTNDRVAPGEYLPVPYDDSPSFLDTPTCFPGGD